MIKKLVTSNKLPISACLIVKNEENYLPGCIKSLKDVVEEIIVNDTGSNDSTLSILKNSDVHYFQSEWNNDFSYSRNLVIEKANQPWILSIDADEILSDDFIQAFHNLDLEHNDAFLLTIINIQRDNELFSTIPHQLVRLFRNNKNYRFKGKIHEQVSESIVQEGGKISVSRLNLIHYGYRENTPEKLKRNMSLLLSEVQENPKDAYTWYQLGITEFGNKELLKAKNSLKKSLAYEDTSFSDEIMFNLYTKLGQIFFSENNLYNLAEVIEILMELDPENPFPYYIKAALHLENGNFSDAIASFNSVLEKNTGNWKIEQSQLYLDIGTAHYKLNQLNEAIEYFSKALNENPESELACYNLGNCFYKAKLLDEAKEMYEWAVKYKPDFEEAKSNLNIVLNQLGI